MKNKKFFKYVVLICLISIIAAVTVLSACGVQGDKGDNATVTVTFDAAGGKLDRNTLTVNKGECIELPEPTRSDYIFDGWYYRIGDDVKRFTDTTPIYDDITLTASWIGDFTEGLAYMLNEDGKSYSCTGMGTYEGKIVKIAPDYNGLPVTAVAANAFAGEQSIEKVVIFDNVERVESGAFSSCPNLKEWQFGSSVKYFGNSGGKSSGSVPNNIKVNYTGSIKDWCEICFDEAYLFYPRGALYLNNEPVIDLVIPDGVTAIMREAFAYCSSIKSVSIPDSVAVIEEEAFGGAVALREVVISDGVKSIGEHAFTDCYFLVKVTLGRSVARIGRDAFSSCGNLIEVYNRSSINIVAGSNNYGRIGRNAINIYTDKSGQSNIIKDEDYIFYADGSEYYLIGYTGAESGEIELPASIDGNCYGIYQQIFYDGDSLTSVVIPESVTSIGDGAFAGGAGPTSIEIPDSVTSIGDRAFSGCSGLTSIDIPDSVTSIGDSAFERCSALENVVIGNSVTSIGDSAFAGCSGLTSIDIPDSVTNIGDYAFERCSALENVVIGNSVTSIGSHAFEGCSGLTSIDIPDSVTSIGSYAFEDCFVLTSVTFKNPDGWLAGSTQIPESALCDPSTAARYLTSTYCGGSWKRS